MVASQAAGAGGKHAFSDAVASRVPDASSARARMRLSWASNTLRIRRYSVSNSATRPAASETEGRGCETLRTQRRGATAGAPVSVLAGTARMDGEVSERAHRPGAGAGVR